SRSAQSMYGCEIEPQGYVLKVRYGISQILPSSSSLSRSGSLAPNALSKLCVHSKTAAGPRKPPRARIAATTPAWDDQPGWSRLVQVPSARYSMMPELWLPQMPKASTHCSAFNRYNLPAAAAAPKVPHSAVG